MSIDACAPLGFFVPVKCSWYWDAGRSSLLRNLVTCGVVQSSIKVRRSANTNFITVLPFFL